MSPRGGTSPIDRNQTNLFCLSRSITLAEVLFFNNALSWASRLWSLRRSISKWWVISRIIFSSCKIRKLYQISLFDPTRISMWPHARHPNETKMIIPWSIQLIDNCLCTCYCTLLDINPSHKMAYAPYLHIQYLWSYHQAYSWCCVIYFSLGIWYGTLLGYQSFT